jgi:hypothetical protein
LENATVEGLPKDEVFVYNDALRQGRTVLVVLVEEAEQIAQVRDILEQEGAESLDAAKEKWWIGTRTAEAETYDVQGWNFTEDEPVFRQGFEAALYAESPGKPYEAMTGYLRARYPDVYNTDAFQRGYARGRAYHEGLLEQHQV